MTRLLAALLFTCAMAGAHAHSDEYMDKQVAPHGGVVRMAGAIHLELVRGAQPMVYVTDHASRELATDGARGTLRMETAAGAREVVLEPAGGNSLRGPADLQLDAVTPVVVFVQLKGSQAETARFIPKAASAGHEGH